MIHLILALIFSFFGLLIYLFPNLIAGYNTMSKEQKENINVATLKKSYLIATLILAGSFALGGSFELAGIEFSFWYYFSFIVLYILSLIIIGHYCDHNPVKDTGKHTKRLVISIFVILSGTFLIAFAILHNLKDTTYYFENNKLVIEGLYGKKVDLQDIHTINYVEEYPMIVQKTNGLSAGKTRKGFFLLDDWGKCLLFVSNHKEGIVTIQLNNNKKILINFKSQQKTKEFYEQLKHYWQHQY